jgi:hypothetical protein
MDEGIHLPSPLRHDEPRHPHLAVLDKADAAIETFKERMPDAYTDCSSLYETAKTLYKEVYHNINAGKLKVHQGSLSVDQFEHDLQGLLKCQDPKWKHLKSQEAIMRKRVEDLYQPIHSVELHVRDARGDGSNDAQKEVVKACNHRLARNFHDAKAEYDALCRYPDGLLSQIELLQKRAEKEAGEIIDKLRKRETSVFKVPALLHKMVGT